MTQDIFVGDYPTQFKGTVKDDGAAMDLSGCSAKKVVFIKPDGAEVVKDATFETDGTDGVLYYNTVAADLDEPGEWEWFARLTWAAGGRETSAARFTVYEH